MNNLTVTILALCAVLSFGCLMHEADAADLYLAPTGNDANPGARDAPFAALERARDAARGLKGQGGGVTVWLRGGVYRRDKAFELTEQDSGAEGAPVAYRAVEGQQPRIVGGPAIPPEAFLPVTDAGVLKRLEELDSPGEYFVDRKTGVLYFWPPSPVAGKEIGLSLLEAPMVSLTGVSNVTFRGLTFEFARGMAVTMAGGSHNRLAGCTIRNIATDAVKIDGGTDNGVLSCDLYNMGGAGVSLSGGDRATLTPCDNFAENCHIHHFGRIFRTHKDALFLNGVGCRASHNLIHDAPHDAMDFGGNDHLVDLNEIHDVCTETDDAGAIYTGRDWTVRGTVIKHNFFHDIGGSAHVGNQAIYVDDNACGVTSVGNVIYRVYRAFLIGGGRENAMDNNVIVECPIPMHIDNRGMSWSGKETENWTTLTTRLAAVPYQQEPWRSRFPQLVTILDDEPGLPKRNRGRQ